MTNLKFEYLDSNTTRCSKIDFTFKFFNEKAVGHSSCKFQAKSNVVSSTHQYVGSFSFNLKYQTKVINCCVTIQLNIDGDMSTKLNVIFKNYALLSILV